MELNAHTRTLSDLLSVNKRYVVPRFQREYSWSKDEVSALWKDVCDQLRLKNGKLVSSEYFVGCLVLVGRDNSPELKIVDGQQRLTTLTILLRAIVAAQIDIKENRSANSVYEKYIEGQDDDGKKFFKLINESPKPYFQECIQNITQGKRAANTDEELLLKAAYDELYGQLSKANLLDKFLGQSKKEKLAALRDQVLNHLKFIYVLVSEEEDAYTIFETLNARGINLSAVDLVKNWLLKNLPEEHPSDKAKLLWDEIKRVLGSSSETVNKDTFFRHFWISRYAFVNEGRMYKSFRVLTAQQAFSASEFQSQVLAEAKIYLQLVSPSSEDHKHHADREVYAALQALNLFRVTSIRPLLMAVWAARAEKKLSVKQQTKVLKFLENFHFLYTSVAGLSSSGFDGKYSRAARDLRNATKVHAWNVLVELMASLAAKRPTKEIFASGFHNIWFSNGDTRDKRLVHYIFGKLEQYHLKTKELAVATISLEHIAPQSTNSLKAVYGKIGNLLPLDIDLNSNAGAKDLKSKIQHYKNSELKIVKDFVKLYGRRSVWDSTMIDERTNEMSLLAFEKIWIIT